jgi:hypothetical protein
VDQSSGHDTGLALAALDDAAVTVELQAYLSDRITAAGSGPGSVPLSGNGHYAAKPIHWLMEGN